MKLFAVLLGLFLASAVHADCTPQTGTIQLTAESTVEMNTYTAFYKLSPCEKLVHIFIPFMGGTSNGYYFAAQGLPALLQPKTIIVQQQVIIAFNNGVYQPGASAVFLAGSGSIFFAINQDLESWDDSGFKAVAAQTLTIALD